jgi:hypothetical protein
VSSKDTAADLRAAWDDLLAELGRARDAIDDPALYPAPANDRNLAEGYRYLMGFVYGAIERAFFEDPRFPYFRNALQPFDKATIDNPDAIYFAARIDGREPTLIRGRAEDFRHWRGQPRAASGRLAPQYLIFEVTSGDLTGDSGSLAELAPGVKARTGWIDCTQLEVEKDGSFEILLAPERPTGHTGNFVPTRIVTSKPGPDGSPERFASYVSGRQLFYDWDREDAVQLGIAQLAAVGTQPPVLDPATAARHLRRLGSIVRGQMHFWNEFYAILLETYGKRDGSDGPRFMPRNAFNQPNAASGATGGGMGTNIYAGGVFELDEGEALVIENRVEVPPIYIGFQLSNLWGESLDYANCITSLNGFQLEPDADGLIRWVIAHRDPGVPNWLDTTGHREGFMAPRWAYTEKPPQERWPTIRATKVPFDQIRKHLPASTRTVSAEERREQIRIRQEHVQRRYRQF